MSWGKSSTRPERVLMRPEELSGALALDEYAVGTVAQHLERARPERAE